jgi:peptidoglycan/xylan/chitin deacetylase (PgdA/CDA1 family)
MLHIVKNKYHRLMPKALVLMYHRINSLEVDPWQLAVEPQKFDQHLTLIKEFGTVLSSTELHKVLQKKKLKNKSIVITFDDGYKDNLTNALPLLQKHQLPATFFIPTNRLGYNGYWWDELEEMIIHNKSLPQKLSLSLHDITIDFDLEEETIHSDDKWNEIKKWRALEGFAGKRTILYERLWQALKQLPYQKQQDILDHLRQWSGYDNSISKNSEMNEEEVLQLASSPLATIGGHTTSHPDLSLHDDHFQQKEITDNKIYLEDLTGREIDFFAYPYGRFNSSTPVLVAKSGYQAAFTTSGWIVKNSDNPYLLNRLHVNNWTADELLQVLNNFFYKPYR